MNKHDTLSEEEKRQIRNAMLRSTCFRESVFRYYAASVEMKLRNIFFLPDEEIGAEMILGNFKVRTKDFRDSLFNLPSAPEKVRFGLRQIIASNIAEAAFLDIFNLLELEKSTGELPVSIRQVIKDLRLPENIEHINKLCGNAEETLDSIFDHAEQIWESHGKTARAAFRNRIAHGYRRAEIGPDFDPEPAKKPSIDFYKASDGIVEILNRISQECFAVESPIISGEDYWEFFWTGRYNEAAWCFDFKKYPLPDRPRFNPSDMILEDSDLD